MQFKYPENLFALFLLLIPIFIHLFQLRRFQKVDFTNVAFLKKVNIQTRKSSQLKKWLTLLARLLALACIIFAFAQPFSTSKKSLKTATETVFYIDNSYSMQAQGPKGPLLERALQDLFDRTEGIERLSWFTNDFERKNSSLQDFKNEILSVDYFHDQLSPNQVLLKANQLFSRNKEVAKRLVYISDFQQKEDFPDIPDQLLIDAVQLKPVNRANISIDSLYFSSINASAAELRVKISKQERESMEVPVSLFQKNKLIAKTAVDLSQNDSGTATFTIDISSGFVGKLEVPDPNISFDNTLYFSIDNQEKIKVLVFSDADTNFLQRLFDDSGFNFTQQTSQTLNYNLIPDQNFIILNELNEIPASLTAALKSFSDNGGSVLIIPSSEANVTSYNNLLEAFSIGSFTRANASSSLNNQKEKRITKIVFSHPLFKDVFDKEVTNFQYPKVNSFYTLSSGASPVLSFEDNSPFVVQKGLNYLFTAPINKENSNFQNSPLIVPTIYNMGLGSLPLPRLYYIIGEQNTLAVPVTLETNEIVVIKDSISQFIPLQNTRPNHVLITLTEDPKIAGNYTILKDDELLNNISFNYSREESPMLYANAKDWIGTEVFSTVNSLFDSLSEANATNNFWKWFAIFAVVFLIMEMLILKLFK